MFPIFFRRKRSTNILNIIIIIHLMIKLFDGWSKQIFTRAIYMYIYSYKYKICKNY